MSLLDNITQRRKPYAIGILKTAPFFSAGVLSLVLFYMREGRDFVLEKDGMIVIIFLLLCWTVYYAVSHQLPYSKKNIIDDILAAAYFCLGTGYRINIMELTTPENRAFDAYFRITYGHGYPNPSVFQEKITMRIPGASDAYRDRTCIYKDKSSLDPKIDPNVKHLWSCAIKDRRGHSIAVLNIDNVRDPTLSPDVVTHNLALNQQLANLVGFYWEIPA